MKDDWSYKTYLRTLIDREREGAEREKRVYIYKDVNGYGCITFDSGVVIEVNSRLWWTKYDKSSVSFKQLRKRKSLFR